MVVALFYWAFIQSFLFGITVLVYRNSQPNRLLATFFFMVSTVILWQYLLKHEHWLFDYPETLFIPDIINICIAPVFFLYSNQIIKGKWKHKNFLHFIPGILFTLYFIFFEIFSEEDFVYFNYISTTAHVIVLTLIVISNVVYLILFYYNYKKCKDFPKKDSQKVKPWLRILFIFFFIQLFINLIIWNLHLNLNRLNDEAIANVREIKDFIFIVLNGITIFITGLFIISNPSVITSLGTKITERFKSKSFKIDEDDAEAHIERLKKIMSEDKVFLDSQLNEKLLAEKLDIQSYYLSKLLNEHLNCSFTEYINRARVEETKRLLESEKSKDLTLFAIAIDSGFSSESVFYTNFKKYVGMTPNQYKKKVLSEKK
jgi:AraC-like DNA-binding protein